MAHYGIFQYDDDNVYSLDNMLISLHWMQSAVKCGPNLSNRHMTLNDKLLHLNPFQM